MKVGTSDININQDDSFSALRQVDADAAGKKGLARSSFTATYRPDLAFFFGYHTTHFYKFRMFL